MIDVSQETRNSQDSAGQMSYPNIHTKHQKTRYGHTTVANHRLLTIPVSLKLTQNTKSVTDNTSLTETYTEYKVCY